MLERKYSFDENGQHNEDNGSENMIIRGDNLEALKALLPRYEGRIKCIYIDPPYNTGNEGWVYNDNVNDPKILRWLGELVGKAGEDLTRHDKWLCMMYPRLKLLYKLLSDDGAIFISLDDNEIFYLRSIMDEIFGASNFTAQITLLCNPKGRSQDKYFATCHEYLLVYTKSAVPAGWFSVEKDDAKIEKDYKLSDAGGKYRLLELRNTHREFGKENRPNLWYPIYANADDGTVSLEKDEQHNIEIYPTWPDGYEGCWTWGTELASKSTQLLVAQKKAGAWKIYRKSYAATDGETVRQKLFTIWNNPQFFTEKGQVAFGQIFPGANKNDFPQPKSVEYVMEAIRTITHDDDIVLDSFAGSGTTGQAVLNLNSDGGHRKFILVEMMDYADSITAERVKRVIKGYGEGKNAVEGTGGNFSFYDLGEPLLVGDCLNEAPAPHSQGGNDFSTRTPRLADILHIPLLKYHYPKQQDHVKSINRRDRPQDIAAPHPECADAFPRNRPRMRHIGGGHPPAGEEARRNGRHPRLASGSGPEKARIRRMCAHRHPRLRPLAVRKYGGDAETNPRSGGVPLHHG